MNRWAIAHGVLWLLTVLFLVAAVDRARGKSMTREEVAGPPGGEVGSSPSPIAPESLSTLEDRIVGADVFRLVRRPSPVAFRASGDGDPPPAPTPPKPPLALSGVIGGPPWSGLLDGVPGHDQSVVVHAGDTIAKLLVRSVTRNRVVIVGLDTTWQLTVRNPWH
jgi:hypothetical protein